MLSETRCHNNGLHTLSAASSPSHLRPVSVHRSEHSGGCTRTQPVWFPALSAGVCTEEVPGVQCCGGEDVNEKPYPTHVCVGIGFSLLIKVSP